MVVRSLVAKTECAPTVLTAAPGAPGAAARAIASGDAMPTSAVVTSFLTTPTCRLTLGSRMAARRSWCTNLWFQKERPRGAMSLPVVGHVLGPAPTPDTDPLEAPAAADAEAAPPAALLPPCASACPLCRFTALPSFVMPMYSASVLGSSRGYVRIRSSPQPVLGVMHAYPSTAMESTAALLAQSASPMRSSTRMPPGCMSSPMIFSDCFRSRSMMTTFLPSLASAAASADPAVPAPTMTTSASYSSSIVRAPAGRVAGSGSAGSGASPCSDAVTSSWMKATPKNANRYSRQQPATARAPEKAGLASVLMKPWARTGASHVLTRYVHDTARAQTATTLLKQNHSHATRGPCASLFLRHRACVRATASAAPTAMPAGSSISCAATISAV